MANLFRDLEDTWERDGESAGARSALQEWSTTRPALARFATPAELVRLAHRRDASARDLIEAITEEAASDPWAARTVLQALLPGLAALASQHLDLVGTAREPFATFAELDQFLVCTAYERITQVAAEVPLFRLRTVLDSTWARLRAHARAHRRDHDRRISLSDVHGGIAAPARSDAETLALLLVDAVERRVLRPADARLVYTTRVCGHSTTEVAKRMGYNLDSLRRRRHRVEQVLVAEVQGEMRPRRCVASAGPCG
ncbi:MAG: hypothetical protein ACRDJN_17870 [Chloroflexota bacterium]